MTDFTCGQLVTNIALAIVIVGLRVACYSASARSLHLVREHNHVCAVGIYNISVPVINVSNVMLF